MLSLIQLKQHLQTHPTVTLSELSISLKEDNGLLEQKLQHFVNKGQVTCTQLTPHCGTRCHSCPSANTIVYEWHDN